MVHVLGKCGRWSAHRATFCQAAALQNELTAKQLAVHILTVEPECASFAPAVLMCDAIDAAVSAFWSSAGQQD